MRILYFAFVELDIPNACQVHTLGVLRGFSHLGCRVDALLPRSLVVRPEIPNVRFFYLWPWQFSALGKMWIKISGCLLFSLLCLFNNYDAIYVRELEMNPFPRWCARVFRIPLYMEINSILIQNIQTTRRNRNRLTKIQKSQIADFLQAKGLIVPSYPRSRWIKEHYGLNSAKVHLLLNGVDICTQKKLDRSETLREMNLPEDAFYLGFLGTAWKNYDLMSILAALESCKKYIDKLYLLFIGGGPDLKMMLNIASIKKISSNIIVLGYIQPEYLYKVIGAIDVGLMILTKQGLEDLGPITTRFATYAAFQIPVIANDIYLEHYPGKLVQGLSVVPPEDPKALADTICWLYNHPEERESNAGVLYDYVVNNLTWVSVTQQILNIINHDKNFG